MTDSNQPDSDSPRPAPNRRETTSASYYHTAVSGARRLRKDFTSENIIASLKTMAWVIPLTILIWVYAEREQLIDEKNVPVSIEVKSTDPTRVVTLVRPIEGNITCELLGSRSKLDQVIELLQPNKNIPPITIEVGPNIPLGPANPIPLLPQIQNNSKFRNNGVSVAGCLPDNLIVSVDRLEERLDIPIVAPNIPGLEKTTFVPSTISIKGPSQLLAKLALDNHLIVTADISSLPILREPGQHTGITVNLLPPDADPNIKLSATTALASLTIRKHDVTYTIPNLPVWLCAPALWKQYRINYDLLVPNVQVSGPSDKIDEITRNEVHPFAELRLGPEDVKNPKPIKLRIQDLPEGVTVVPGSMPDVNYTVQPAE